MHLKIEIERSQLPYDVHVANVGMKTLEDTVDELFNTENAKRQFLTAMVKAILKQQEIPECYILPTLKGPQKRNWRVKKPNNDEYTQSDNLIAENLRKEKLTLDKLKYNELLESSERALLNFKLNINNTNTTILTFDIQNININEKKLKSLNQPWLRVQIIRKKQKKRHRSNGSKNPTLSRHANKKNRLKGQAQIKDSDKTVNKGSKGLTITSDSNNLNDPKTDSISSTGSNDSNNKKSLIQYDGMSRKKSHSGARDQNKDPNKKGKKNIIKSDDSKGSSTINVTGSIIIYSNNDQKYYDISEKGRYSHPGGQTQGYQKDTKRNAKNSEGIEGIEGYSGIKDSNNSNDQKGLQYNKNDNSEKKHSEIEKRMGLFLLITAPILIMGLSPLFTNGGFLAPLAQMIKSPQAVAYLTSISTGKAMLLNFAAILIFTVVVAFMIVLVVRRGKHSNTNLCSIIGSRKYKKITELEIPKEVKNKDQIKPRLQSNQGIMACNLKRGGSL